MRAWEGTASVSAQSFALPIRVPRKRLTACRPGWVGLVTQLGALHFGGCWLVLGAGPGLAGAWALSLS